MRSTRMSRHCFFGLSSPIHGKIIFTEDDVTTLVLMFFLDNLDSHLRVYTMRHENVHDNFDNKNK